MQVTCWLTQKKWNQRKEILCNEITFENVVCKAQIIFVQNCCVEEKYVDSEVPQPVFMMTSSNGNIFRVTGPLCGEFTGPGEFPSQRPVTRSFDVFFDLRVNKRLSKQP